MPREHGAWAQLAAPLLTALLAGGARPAGLCWTVAVIALFFAHEPLLVLLGQRGPRVKRALEEQARQSLARLAGVALLGAACCALIAPETRPAIALSAVLGAGVLPFTWRKAEKTLPGELLVGLALASAAAPPLVAVGRIDLAVAAGLAWALVFSLSTVTVRAVIAQSRSETVVPGRWVAGGLAGATLLAAFVAWTSGLLHPVAAVAPVPIAVAALRLAARPPSPKLLKKVGWTLAACFTVCLLLLGPGLLLGGCSTPAPAPAGEVEADGHAATPAPAEQAALRVLFVGNSYTFSHDLPALLAQMGDAAEPPRRFVTRMVAEPGWTLEQHWQDRRAVLEIRSGDWDHVVLQGHSLGTVQERDRLFEYARRFDAVIRDSGGSTVLFMTWARRDQPEMLQAVQAGYEELGRELAAEVAPVGVAWARSWQARPDIHLWHVDGSHPSPAGTWLAASVFYGLLTDGASPVGIDHAGFGQLDSEEIEALQRVAADLTRSPPEPR
jgi:hypothetical protein